MPGCGLAWPCVKRLRAGGFKTLERAGTAPAVQVVRGRIQPVTTTVALSMAGRACDRAVGTAERGSEAGVVGTLASG